MTTLVEASVLVDFLRGHPRAGAVLDRERAEAPLHASDMSRVEVLAGMRPEEEPATHALLSALTWHPLDIDVAEEAGVVWREWLPSHRSIDGADLVVAWSPSVWAQAYSPAT